VRVQALEQARHQLGDDLERQNAPLVTLRERLNDARREHAFDWSSRMRC
jgi:hypothetical protein